MDTHVQTDFEKRPLILVGGGGHCKAVIDVARCAGYTIDGILDLPDKVGSLILGVPVVGSDDDMARYVATHDFVVTLGSIRNAAPREKLYNMIKTVGGRLATIVSADASVSRYASLGEGTVVLHRACINASAVIGANVIINTMADIEHDTVIGDHAHISTSAVVNGNCVVGCRCFIGSNVTVYNNVRIGDDIVVGGGYIVARKLSKPGIYIGNPLVRL